MESPRDVAAIRLDNALVLFDEFVRSTAQHADAAALRGLERRFAERLQIQPSYWSQIKGRSRQIGERLARQFEQCCGKPAGWMDMPRHAAASASPAAGIDEGLPRDDDERFIVGLVLSYYRRHPQRARTRLLDLLGEVLMPEPAPAASAVSAPQAAAPLPPGVVSATTRPVPGSRAAALGPGILRPQAPTPAPASPAASPAEAAHALWLQSQAGVAPLKRKR